MGERMVKTIIMSMMIITTKTTMKIMTKIMMKTTMKKLMKTLMKTMMKTISKTIMNMYAVLEMHQKRNRSICPPKLIQYCNHGETSLAVSCHATDASKASHCQPVDHAAPRPHHTNDTSRASHRQPVDHIDADTPDGNQDNDGVNKEIEHGSNNNNADDEDKDEDTEVNVPKQ